MIFSAGIQDTNNWSKPETVDLDCKQTLKLFCSYVYLVSIRTDLRSEINVNYTAIVTMTIYLLPHFLKLGVVPLPFFNYCHHCNLSPPIVRRPAMLHCPHFIWSRNLPNAFYSKLLSDKSGFAQLESFAQCTIGEYECVCYGDHPTACRVRTS